MGNGALKSKMTLRRTKRKHLVGDYVTVDDKNGRKREKVKNFCGLYKGG